jgi:hypothetical protein
MSQKPLELRLYSEPHLYELARAVGYGGKTVAEMRPVVKILIAVHGADKIAEALQELTIMERDTNRTVLLPHVRKLCFKLLGPAPEHPQHDEVRYAHILYSKEERQEWRQRFAAEKQAKVAEDQAGSANNAVAEPAKKGRRKGRSR